MLFDVDIMWCVGFMVDEGVVGVMNMMMFIVGWVLGGYWDNVGIKVDWLVSCCWSFC